MNLENKNFTYPVLADSTGDYLSSTFSIEIKMETLRDTVSLTFTPKLNNEGLWRLIGLNKIVFYVLVDCRKTRYRKGFSFTSESKTIEISHHDLNRKVNLTGYLLANEMLDSFTNDDLDEDYDGISFEIDRGAILGYCDLGELFIEKEFNEFFSSSSIFSLTQADREDGKMNVSYADKICIELARNDYKQFLRESHTPNGQQIINTMIVFPALLDTLYRLKIPNELDEQLDNSLWGKTIIRLLQKMGIDRDNYEEIDPLSMAQRIMENPVNIGLRSFGAILTMDAEEED